MMAGSELNRYFYSVVYSCLEWDARQYVNGFNIYQYDLNWDSIEKIKLANVYTFESEEASTLSAGEHYIFALESCDVCIFLIDNADGIPQGVQNEIDTAKRNKIKSIFYFCDETKKETLQF